MQIPSRHLGRRAVNFPDPDFGDIAGDVVGVVAIQCFGMLKAVAIANCRSLRHIVIPLQNLNVLTGANGSGKSSFIGLCGSLPIPRRVESCRR